MTLLTFLFMLLVGFVPERSDVGEEALRIAVRPRGHDVAIGGTDGTVTLVDAAKGDRVRTFRGARGRVERLAWSADGRFLVGGFFHGASERPATTTCVSLTTPLVSWVVWNADLGGVVFRTRSAVSDRDSPQVSLNDDGRFLALCGIGDTLQIWRLADGLPREPPSKGRCTAAIWIPATGRLVTGDERGNIRVIDAEKCVIEREAHWRQGAVSVLSVSRATGSLIAGAEGLHVSAWRLPELERVWSRRVTPFQFPADDDYIACIATAIEGRIIVGTGTWFALAALEEESGTFLWSRDFDRGCMEQMRATSSPDGRHVAIWGFHANPNPQDVQQAIWSSSGMLEHSLERFWLRNGATSVVWTPDGSLLILHLGGGGGVQVLDGRTYASLRRITIGS